MKARLNIVVALSSEAKPLIEYYRLRRITDDTCFTHYKNQDDTIHLIISGLGKIKSAMAVSYLYGQDKSSAQTFLNIGIAGSEHYSIGECVLVNKVIDHATKRCWYPAQILKHKLETNGIKTFDEPQYNYKEDTLVDMESSGFYEAAKQFVTQEYIYLLKIISDNPSYQADQITSSFVTEIIENNIENIASIANQLLTLSYEESERDRQNDHLKIITNQLHFTQYQRHQLKDILRRANSLDKNSIIISILKQAKTAKDFLESIENALANLDYVW